MPRPGASVMLVNSGLVVLVAVRVRVTIFWPPISVTAWAWLKTASGPAIKTGKTRTGRAKGSRASAFIKVFISIHPWKCN